MENTNTQNENAPMERDIQKALKDMLDHLMILNDDEKLSSDTLITMAVDSLCEDEEYGLFVDKNSEQEYLQQIANALSEKGLTFYDVNILECHVCSHCSKVLLPLYDEFFIDSSTKLILCNACDRRLKNIPSLSVMTLDQFEKIDRDFTFPTGIKLVIGQGICLPNGMVHCKVEGAYEKFFANRKDAFENIFNQNHYVPHAYLELNNGFDKSLLDCIKLPQAVNELTNANDYTTRQLLEKEFQNVPNSTNKENLIAEALQLVEECGYTVGEAANTILSEKKGL